VGNTGKNHDIVNGDNRKAERKKERNKQTNKQTKTGGAGEIEKAKTEIKARINEYKSPIV